MAFLIQSQHGHVYTLWNLMISMGPGTFVLLVLSFVENKKKNQRIVVSIMYDFKDMRFNVDVCNTLHFWKWHCETFYFDISRWCYPTFDLTTIQTLPLQVNLFLDHGGNPACVTSNVWVPMSRVVITVNFLSKIQSSPLVNV